MAARMGVTVAPEASEASRDRDRARGYKGVQVVHYIILCDLVPWPGLFVLPGGRRDVLGGVRVQGPDQPPLLGSHQLRKLRLIRLRQHPTSVWPGLHRQQQRS